MEGVLASLWVKLDVLAAQIINLVILFVVFKYFLWDKLSAALQERKDKLAKLEQAELAYDEMIAQASVKRDELIAAGTASKKQIISDATALAEIKKAEIIEAAQAQAAHIKAQADQSREAEKTQLYTEFESLVKKTASLALNKLIPSKADAYASYLEEIDMKQ